MKRLDLDWIRGLAAIGVLISHILLFYPSPGGVSVLQHAGRVGVEVFFVLSGLLISLSWAAKPSLPDYAARRACRILPLMWIVMAVVFFILTPIFWEWSLAAPEHWLAILMHFAGVQSMIPLDIPGLFIGLPLWTLTVEICFYIALPFLWKWFIRAPANWVIGSLVVEFAWRIGAEKFVAAHGLSEQWAIYLPLQLPGQAFGFAVGMLLAWMLLQIRAKESAAIGLANQWCERASLTLPINCGTPMIAHSQSKQLCHADSFGRGWVRGWSVEADPWERVAAHETPARWLIRQSGRMLGVWPENMMRWVGVRAGLVGLLAGIVYFPQLWESGASILVFPLTAGMLIWFTAHTPQVHCAFVGEKVEHNFHALLSFLGKISYSLYLWHFTVLFLLMRGTSGVGLSFEWFAISGIGLSVLVAGLSFYWIEKPFLEDV